MPLKSMEILKRDFDTIKMRSIEAQKARKEATGFFYGEKEVKTAKVEEVLHFPYKPAGSQITGDLFLKLLIEYYLVESEFLSKTKYEHSDQVGMYHSHYSGILLLSETDLMLMDSFGDVVHFLYAPPSDYMCRNKFGENVNVIILDS